MSITGFAEGFRVWWAGVGGWGPARRALRRFDTPQRAGLIARVRALARAMVRHGLSPRQTLRWAVPAAAARLSAPRLAAALALAVRLAARRIDPAPVLAAGLDFLAGDPTHLRALERLTVRLAAEPHLDWTALEPQLPALAREAADLDGAGRDYALRVVPQRGLSVFVAGPLPGYDCPVLVQEAYWVESPQQVQLVAAPPRAGRRKGE
jgi:hypothetical protein